MPDSFTALARRFLEGRTKGRDMTKSRKPALPAAVAARMAKRIFMTITEKRVVHAHDRFIKSVRDGAIPNRDDMQIVAAQLESVLSKKKTFARAFGLIAGQGRKSDQKTDWRNNLINAEVEELRDAGWSLEKAADHVSQRYSVSSDLVLKVHKQRYGLTRNAKWSRKRGMGARG